MLIATLIEDKSNHQQLLEMKEQLLEMKEDRDRLAKAYSEKDKELVITKELYKKSETANKKLRKANKKHVEIGKKNKATISKQAIEIKKLKSDKKSKKEKNQIQALQIELLKAENQSLKEITKELTEANKVLFNAAEAGKAAKRTNDEKRKTNSSNSHNSSSTDKYVRFNPKKEKSDRPVGGQVGHIGSNKEQSKEVDETIKLPLCKCPVCNEDLTQAEVIKTEKRQVHELNESLMRLQVKQYEAEVKYCSTCKKNVTAKFPENVNSPVQYGVKFRVLTTWLNQYQIIPYKRLSKILRKLFNIKISVASIESFNKRLEIPANEVRKIILDFLKKSYSIHLDETGLWVNGKRMWAHVICTSQGTIIRLSEKRGYEGFEEHVKEYNGVMVHDGWASYKKCVDCEHGLCNVHHIRELVFMDKVREHKWAVEIINLLLEMKKLKETLQSQNIGINQLTDYESWRQKLIDILEKTLPEFPLKERIAGTRGRIAQSKERNLLLRLLNGIDEVMAFARDFKIAFGNNEAERSIRMLKVVENMTGGFRTIAGAKRQLTLRSIIQTLEKQGLDVCKSLEEIQLGQFEINSLVFTAAE